MEYKGDEGWLPNHGYQPVDDEVDVVYYGGRKRLNVPSSHVDWTVGGHTWLDVKSWWLHNE